MSGPIIRPARVDDAPAIASIADELRAHVGDPTGHFTAEIIVRDGFGQMPEFELIVSELGSRVVGYALFQDAYEPAFAAKGIYLTDLSVTASARGSGVGRALVDRLGAIALERGRRYVWWLASPKNTTALAFYQHIGVDMTVPSVSHVRILAPA